MKILHLIGGGKNVYNDYLLEMRGITKEYYGNAVLKDVELILGPGEIHSLVGENGAGKSTLMNILFGMDVIHSTGGFDGTVKFGGKNISIKSPKEAMELGIGMVHQEFMLIPDFSVTENIKLNREITKANPASAVFGKKLNTVDFENMGHDARNALDTLAMDIDEWVRVEGLPVGHMQFIEIAREIDKENIRLLVFDEPTAVLTESEAENLLEAIKRLASKGIAILFISHRLDEVIEISDYITVLRDGELVTCKTSKETSVEELAEWMVGRKIALSKKETSLSDKDEIILDIKGYTVDMPGEKVKGIDLQVRKGEILGIGGLAGQGKLGIANGLMGMYPSTGEVVLNEKLITARDTKSMLNSGISFVSEDRKGVGLILDDSIEMNMVITALNIQDKFLYNFGLFKLQKSGAIRRHALEMIEDLDIRCTGPRQYAGSLSGGNQQKVCIARALTLEPDILLISEPTRGIDIGAKKLVLDLLVDLNKKRNMTIIMTSSELAELRSVADRIAIISEGKIAGVLEPDASDKEFGLLMAGRINQAEKEGA